VDRYLFVAVSSEGGVMARTAQTYAPKSQFQSTEEFVRPTMGSGVEISVAWNERVIGTYHFHRQGTVSVGTHPSCDIVLPLIHTFRDRIDLVKIDYGVEINVPPGMKTSLGQVDDSGLLSIQNVQVGSPSLMLGQKEILHLHLSDSIKLLIRPSQQTINPKLIPFLDFSSNGFLSLAFAMIVSLIIAMFVKLNPTPHSLNFEEDVYSTPMLLQNPMRLAEIIKPRIQKVDLRNTKIKPSISKSKTKDPGAAKVSPKVKVAGNKTKAASLAKNRNKTKNRVGSKIRSGKSVKTSSKQGAQAKSPDIRKSKLFAAIGNFGKRNELDTSYDGPGGLAGLANKASGSAGESVDREGEKFGSRFREAGSSANGKNNVGVAGLSGGSGLGPGLGSESLGARKSVSIIPSGEGATFSGTIDREGIRKVFFDNSRALRKCYERSLISNGGLTGKMVLNFDIGPGGQVVGRPTIQRGASTLVNAAVSACVLGRLKAWRFPDPPSGQVVNVLYPLAFSSR